jgi:L-fuculose-phosphate aldolase
VADIVLVQRGQAEAGRTPSRASRAHAAIYARHPDIHAVVNAYTVNATAFSITGATLDSRTIPESYIFLREINVLPYGVPFQKADEPAQHLSAERPIALLENDGVMVCGTSVLDAFDRLEVLESTAEAIINARHLGEIAPMNDAVINELTMAFLKK